MRKVSSLSFGTTAGCRPRLAARSRELIASRDRIIAATQASRHRVERDLQRRFPVAPDRRCSLLLALCRAEPDTDALDNTLQGVVDQTERVLAHLRTLSHGLVPTHSES